jgi:predicted metal-dependent enzyme (double-stranded beta helix superfamily)
VKARGLKTEVCDLVVDATAILEGTAALEEKKKAIAERLTRLSEIDNLTRVGLPLGPTDASTQNYLLWRQPPHTAVLLSAWEPGYQSPVHEHGDHWVVSCGYRGVDRWDMYERLDDGSKPGYAEVKLVDQYELSRGKAFWMPAPPRAIHSHNNAGNTIAMEILFISTPALPMSERLHYDVEGRECWPTWFRSTSVLNGEYYPPRMAPPSARCRVPRMLRNWGCAICDAMRAAAPKANK